MTKFPVDKLQKEPTPVYYYDLNLLNQTLTELNQAANHPAFRVHYAVKANNLPEILQAVNKAGLGADTVSLGEIYNAVEAGIPGEKIVFAGVGKTDTEIKEALRLGVGAFNVESKEELEVIASIAAEMGMNAPVALRVNPEIDAHTHHYITTGLAENKFGIALEMLSGAIEYCIDSPHLEFKGLHFHIGSQVTDFTPYKILCERINDLQERFSGLEIPTINVGGGLGIDYDDPDANPIPDFKEYFDVFKKHLKIRSGQTVHFELGRAIVAQCGSLISRVVFVKKGLGKKFVILDAGMSDLIRPALYQAHHKIENLTSKSDKTEIYDVVGPICESADTFGVNEVLPLTLRGDLIALRSAGAYGQVMASIYNCRKLPSQILSD